MKNLSLALLFCILLSIASYSQTMAGEVTDVLDGKTFTLQAKTKFTVELQYVDPPESSQPLHDVVKNHLTTMLKGKSVVIHFSSLRQGKTIAKVLLGDVDVSLQLLRDGAAWYSVPESSSQPELDRREYIKAESLARSEKRGVWALSSDIRPAWELRVARQKEEERRLDAEQKALTERIAKMGIPKFPALGMTVTELLFVCGSHPRDYISVSESSTGQTTFIILRSTPARISKMCFGSFGFDDGKLARINRDSDDF